MKPRHLRTRSHILKRALRHLPPSCENANESWPSAPYESITLGQGMPLRTEREVKKDGMTIQANSTVTD